ncbi:hypothetical protein ACOZFM_35760 [Streptomyces arboris]|uniref:hypothetical protein n=1 Tax=Streptomyces arboris TaxID=2600619 RepID=UPI003BF57BBA
MSLVAVADTNALYRLLDPRVTGHEAHTKGLAAISHLIISPFVPAELDYLITTKAGPAKLWRQHASSNVT